MVKEASIQLKSGSETRRKCEVSCNQFRGFSWLFYFKIHASFFSIYLSTIFLWLRYDMIYININIYDKYMMINKIGNFCKIVWGFKIKSESLISETAGRRALKTKFSPPPGPPRTRVDKINVVLGLTPVLGLTLSWVWPCLGFDLSWVWPVLGLRVLCLTCLGFDLSWVCLSCVCTCTIYTIYSMHRHDVCIKGLKEKVGGVRSNMYIQEELGVNLMEIHKYMLPIFSLVTTIHIYIHYTYTKYIAIHSYIHIYMCWLSQTFNQRCRKGRVTGASPPWVPEGGNWPQRGG